MLYPFENGQNLPLASVALDTTAAQLLAEIWVFEVRDLFGSKCLSYMLRNL